MSQSPSAMGQMILALDMLQGPTPEIVLLGDAAGAAIRVVLDDLRSRYLPNKVVACRGPQHTGQVYHRARWVICQQTARWPRTHGLCLSELYLPSAPFRPGSSRASVG